jgi:hypothetical protein
MKSAIVQRTYLNAVPPITPHTTPRKRELIARWITADGRLTCFLIEQATILRKFRLEKSIC